MLEEGKIYKEVDLVELIGTEKQKEAYRKEGCFSGSRKGTFLKRLDRLCKYKEYKGRRYRITEVFKYPLPVKFDKMCSSLYQYIIPELLNILLNTDGYRATFTLDEWAMHMNMIKREYHNYKFNQEILATRTQQDIERVKDFYLHSTNTLRRYFLQSIEYLRSQCDVHMYIIGKVYITHKLVDAEGNIVDFSEVRDATEDERILYEGLLRELDKEFHIKNDGERYYSNKSVDYLKELKKRLQDSGIDMFYKAYELHAMRPEKMRILLDQIENFGTNNTQTLDIAYTELLVDNSGKRYDKDIIGGKYKKMYPSAQVYKDIVKEFCNITIVNDNQIFT